MCSNLISMRVSKIFACLTAACLGVAVLPAMAQDKASREREALVRAQRAVAKMQQENAALSREKGELAAKLETVNSEQAGLKGEAARARGRAAATEKELGPLREERDALKQKLEASEAQLAQTAGQYKEAQLTQQRIEAERSAVQARLKQETQSLLMCSATNEKLHALTRDLAQRYEQAAVDRVDPVFGLRRVEIENEMQGYRDRIDEAKLPVAR